MITKQTKILTCCSAGQNRSVHARNILMQTFGLRAVIAAGLDGNDPDTLEMLFAWADVILVVGEKYLADKVPSQWRMKMHHLDVGSDKWGWHQHGRLMAKLRPEIEAIMRCPY